MNERWPHPSVVAKELRRLQAEKAVAEWDTHHAFITELRKNMEGHNKHYNRIMRRRSTLIFTQKMLRIGERIIRELEENGRTLRR